MVPKQSFFQKALMVTQTQQSSLAAWLTSALAATPLSCSQTIHATAAP